MQSSTGENGWRGRALATSTGPALLGGAALALALSACGDPRATASTGGLDLREAMGGQTEGYARARAPRQFSFPADHGAHPEFRTEWWYFTGNLTARDGREFGFQWTLFRNAVAPAGDDVPERSAFRTRQVWMGHFAVTDVAGGIHHGFERFGRGALGLCGAEVEPRVHVWLEDWDLRARSPGALFPAQLAAAEGEVALDLWLTNNKPYVLQGEQGLSRKGPEDGNASFYYSCTRLSASGTLRLGREELQVRGNAWLDREWSTSALGEGVVGWDWFALQLAPMRELMVYRLRRADGTADPFSRGVFVRRDGSTVALDADAFEVEPVRTWRRGDGEAAYPVAWRIVAPAVDLDVEVEAMVDDQEFEGAVRYWEGAVRVTGSAEGQPADGKGYLEMTGYDPRAGRR